ncbi:ARM repeat protein interacting with ABF2 [Vitis vinifera]|uniref:ARM repeat protein interacting with ABF2 n=1 Tax=Vitis vinifera TaxID=29760 RepID=A0A438FYG5_VITVI|nr:ARM repeat protein interacting with ABF2 [Vitis vinifera]
MVASPRSGIEGTAERRGSERRRTFEFYWPRARARVIWGGLPLRLTGFSCFQNHCLGIGRTSSRRGEEHERLESLSLLQDRGLASGFLGVCLPESVDLRRPTGELNPTGFLMMLKHERSESLGLLQDRGTRIRFLGVCSPGSIHFPPYRFIYTGSVEIILDIAQDLLIATDQYLCRDKASLCECTIAHDISLENVSRMHELSEAFHAISLRHTCLMSILEQFSKLSSRAGCGSLNGGNCLEA